MLIEPGFIRSSFSDATIDRIKLSNRTDPYAAFNQAVAAATRAAYRPDTIAKLGGEADDVAAVVEPTGHLLWHGVDPDVTMALMLAWKRVRCRPPLEDEEVIRTVRSIERTQTKGNDGSLRDLTIFNLLGSDR